MTDVEFIIEMKKRFTEGIGYIPENFAYHVYNNKTYDYDYLVRRFEGARNDLDKYLYAQELSNRLTQDKDRLGLLLLVVDYLL